MNVATCHCERSAAIQFRGIVAVGLFLLTIVSTATAKYSGGTGEPNNPYQIATAADLIALGEDPNDYGKHFLLTADIDLDPNLPGRKVFDKAVIAPDIDDTGYEFDGTSFTGVFDGDGHTILHLTITGKGYLGLFGELDGCDVSKLGVADVNVMGSGDYVGGLAGSNGDLKTGLGRITDCWSTGTVSGHWEVGGLVGQNLAWVTHCHTSATVSGNTYVGALLGFSRGDVSQCYSAGAVSSTWDGGGLVGENVGLVAYCCSTAVVSGSWEVGGLVGRNYADVSQSYAAGMVSGSSSEVGGLIGYNYGDVSQCHSTAVTSGSWEVGGLVGENSGSVAHCYCTGMTSGSSEIGGLVARNDGEVVASFWDKQTSAQITSAGGTGKTTAEMQTRKTFVDAGWDFVDETTNGTEDIWWINEGKDYPRLWWEKYSGGTGEPNDPYRIATAADLIALGETPEDYDKHFILTADIDLDPNLPGGKVFDKAVIAPDVDPTNEWWRLDGDPFTGVFDGNGHTISHLTIKGRDCLGVFGRLASEAEVRNLGVIHITIVGSGDCVGGLVGYNSGLLTHCYTTVALRGNSAVGGLAGWNVGDVGVRRCYSTGVVRGGCGVGGLVGGNGGRVTQSHSNSTVIGTGWQVGGLLGSNEATLTQSSSTGTVSSSGVYVSVGGLAGSNDAPGEICDCYSTSAVSGSGKGDVCVGGLVALNTGYVVYCYSAGNVSGSGSKGGLVAGGDRGAVNASFWDTRTSGQGASRGGTGKTTAQMQMASTFLDTGWDFMGETANGTQDLWWIDEGKDYPRLWWEAPTIDDRRLMIDD